MKVYAGLDGGSTYLKAALIDERGKVLRTGVTSTGIDNNGAAKRLLAQLMAETFEMLLGDNLQARKDHIAEVGAQYLDMADIS